MREDVSSNDNIKPQLHQTSNLHTTKGHNNIESVVNSEHTVVEFRSDTVDLHPTARIALVPLPAQDQDNQTREASNITVISRSGPDQNADVVTRMSNTSRVNALEPPLPGDFIGKRDSGLASINLESTQPCNLPTQKVTSNGVRASILENYRQSSTESKGSDTGNMSDTGSATFLPPTAAQETYKASSPSIIDARSFTNKSIGDRSLAAPSTISPEDEVLSLRVRSLYDSNTTKDSSSHVFTEPGQRRVSSIIEEGSVILAQECLTGNDKSEDKSTEDSCRASFKQRPLSQITKDADRRSAVIEGIEDWDNLEGQEVDRYGFINSTYISSSAPAPPDPRMAPRRVATALFVQSQQPRKRALKHLRLSSSAPEMLQSPTHPKQIREKEDTRSRKWREMAVLKNMTERGIDNCRGGGVEWSFMVKDPKLISRTWKGIPDCWRGAAWHAFLTASAKTRGIGKPDTDLVTIYYELLERPSSDDVQIDLDVPRTINSHIMFRRRYRGGQRLLFRVLHSLALYSPEVGYVQGMASLAATLLCYYDEEITFVMLVRLWELRGLEKLYKSGFGGLMDALEEFENRWMKGNQINKKLTSLGVSSTAYGTRWYLTLFNYSIPFPAQLRVWDVFMLLGDPDLNSPSPFCGTLDVLHATSAAILDGMKSIILKSDFEDAMKNLTSFLPVKDEDMLMKVAKAEWKMRKRK